VSALLTPKQIEANRLLGSPASNIMLRGGSRSGKTFLLVRAVCIRAMKAPNSRHAIFRLRRNHLRASVWQDTLPKVMRMCFPDVPLSKNETDLTAEFPNGSQLALGGLDDKDRVEKILGSEYATLYFNEASQIPWASIETAMTRLAQNVGLALKAYFDCNPPSKLHWSYQLFRQHLKPGTKEPVPNPGDYVEMLVNPADNRANLPAKYFDILAGMSEAQRQRFERGEWASEVSGALWTLDRLDEHRATWDGDSVIFNGSRVDLQRVVVAVDPSGTKGDGTGDDIGIVAAGKGVDGRAYVLEDASCQLSPEGWGRRAVDVYRRRRADRIVAERNFGGAMVETVIRIADKSVSYKDVTASRGKVVRAEPIAALYEQGRVSHVGVFPDLEDQMANMTASGYVGERSPDRADAMVWALTELMLEGSTSFDNL
jgi:predicted phage terminase large subunit-like protein